ncbi:hypothetical protein C7E25_22735, partial [Stenotrophomonas maltophilia]
ADYQRLHPGTEVVYEDIITQDLYARYLHDRGGPGDVRRSRPRQRPLRSCAFTAPPTSKCSRW